MEEKNDVRKLAELARIGLTDAEAALFERELPAILDFFNELAGADTSGAEREQPSEGMIARLDEVSPADRETRDRIVENFPRRSGDSLSVHSVLSTDV